MFGVFGCEEANPDARFPKREAGVAEGPGWALDEAAKEDNTATKKESELRVGEEPKTIAVGGVRVKVGRRR